MESKRISNNNDTMKRLLEDILLHNPPDSVSGVFDKLICTCKNKGIEFDAAAALEYWWSLARLGVVAVPGANLNEQAVSSGTQPCKLVVTERGKKLLERGEQSPHDPPKYLAAVRRRVESPDEITITYLNESIGAWVAGLYRASAVMLGCACERLVLMLAGEIASANLPPWSDKIRKKLKGTIVGVSELFDVVRDCLAQLSNEKKLPGTLGDAIDRKLSPIFEHARSLRNKTGHPTGVDVTSEDAEASLLLFSGFHGLVSDLCKNLRSGNSTGTSA
ncbi:MAG: hypothetical protein HZA50_00860 [Planctomycetes bacterium]|nr:hypothetical protein [Planctomycetota bacterium]